MIVNILCVVGAFLFMEFMAWFAHKFIMHGFLWILHKDHHVKEPGFFEKNDAFFLIFAIPSMLLFVFGSLNNFDFRVFLGLGILLYGACYFLVHDVLIHKLFKWFRKVNHPYLKAIQRAHYQHHSHLGKEKGECFGMLIVPRKYYKKVKAEELRKAQA